MIFEQKEIQLQPYKRGYHSITNFVLDKFPEIKKIEKGFFKVFIKHTSASLTINEDADPSVRVDFESHFNKMIPENAPYYIHTYEGSDDMPAHLKASVLGCSIEIPITNGRLNLGTWQGIYLCEHRNYGGARKLVLSAFGV
ncbi:secondary thiamine-phosphate synthase enzyme YjbQ [uncultured Polaribacter sp.]|uniref:secondary thiamine-phosphate synthase enzyme YjbQ n=1 Tax=uncultured Polaribacter sp. TaxID=174711 RepID=UPI0026252ABD|nr:secondary thiamine-phosphate synthase enzyme YjbQ [uncultured Polaribacter sp.]